MVAQPIESGLVDVVVQFLKRLASLQVSSSNSSANTVMRRSAHTSHMQQERAHHQNPLQSKRSRRLVLGLHEVHRGLVVKKIRLLLVASDIEECGVIDEKLAEILEIARRDDVPMVSPMNRSVACLKMRWVLIAHLPDRLARLWWMMLLVEGGSSAACSARTLA